MEQVEEERSYMMAVDEPAPITACTYPVREHNHLLTCGWSLTAIYVNSTGWLYHRCRRHDGPKTQLWASQHGFIRHYPRTYEDGEACGVDGKEWPCR